jgi:Ca2+-transporting ATPase
VSAAPSLVASDLSAPDQPWAASPEQLEAAFQTDLRAGLSTAEATRRLASVGRNELDEGHRPRAWTLLARQFANTMTLVLAAAAAVTFVVGERTDTVVIVVIVTLNAIVGFIQEYRAENAVAALKQLATTSARVVRDSDVAHVAAPELVPGDVVRLAAGDLVPADIRLVEVQGLRTNESALTGESNPQDKSAEPEPSMSAPLVTDQHNMAFKGTAATSGRGSGVVVSTGMATELGHIAGLLGERRNLKTPLQRRLASLGRRLAAAALVVCAVVFVAGVARGEPVEQMFLTAVSLAVAAIPEGLPAVVTVALALGARRMAERRAVIRRLPAVETLGSVSVICTDKTGTLTENRMAVERVWTPSGTYAVTGTGYEPAGSVTGPDGDADPCLRSVGEVAAACNDALLHAPAAEGGVWTLTGDPTEGALAALAGRLGVDRALLETDRPRCAEIGFDANRKRMTTIHRADDRYWVTVKGALGVIAARTHPDDAQLAASAEDAGSRLADEGYRVLAIAERFSTTVPDDLEELETHLRLVGLVGIADPPRAQAAASIAACRDAGITPVMITGDHPRTAAAIARRLGLLSGGNDTREVMTGEELDRLDDATLTDRVTDVRVYARTNPEQKLRIVDAWKRYGAVVAMTGDGVNDAPALQRADIGVAMGITGTDVSKEVADMVLADDNFATIIDAVEEGRRIYDNIRRFVRYLLTTNSGEISVMLIGPLLGLPIPLVAAQILWINLVTDGLPAVALGLEPAERDAMRRRPRPAGESILAGGLWQHALGVGLFMAAVTLPLQAVTRAAGWPWQTMVFATLALLQLGLALAMRSEHESAFKLGFRTNPWLAGAVAVSASAQLAVIYVGPLQTAFHTEALTAVQLAIVIILSSSAFVAVEIEKWWRRRAVQTAAGHPDQRKNPS